MDQPIENRCDGDHKQAIRSCDSLLKVEPPQSEGRHFRGKARNRLHGAGPGATSFLWLETTAWWSWSDSNQLPKCYGTWLVSDQPTSSDTPADRRSVCCFA